MKIRVLSDLHLEFMRWTPPSADADVVVLAGDIHVGARGLEWARREFPETPVIYVPGNHEFYRGRLQRVLEDLRRESSRLGINLLDKGELTVNGARFLGATLWTDFALYGSAPPKLGRAMAIAKHWMTDYQIIMYGDDGLFRPEHARDIHLEQVSWLANRLAEPVEGPTVVVTHHLPHRRSIHRKYAGDELNPSFASDLDHLVRPPVSLWIHGHTHESVDYVVNGTRVVCNPRGYLPGEPNTAFDPTLVVELAALGPLTPTSASST